MGYQEKQSHRDGNSLKRRRDFIYNNTPVNDRVEQIRKRIKSRSSVQTFDIDMEQISVTEIHDMCQQESDQRPQKSWIERMEDKYQEWYSSTQSWEQRVVRSQHKQKYSHGQSSKGDE